jgi:hypothetical protein
LPRIVRGQEHALVRNGALPAATLALHRGEGRVVTDHRTSWVRELQVDGATYFVKVYEYATWGSRLRDFATRTGPWARSRAAAEFDALHWMTARGLPAPEAILAGETRRCGFLVRALLVTAAFPGDPVDSWLERLRANERRELAHAIGALVGRLHRLGFRDGNLDLRNLLARRDAGGWIVAKIDSPRHRLRAPGSVDQRLQADWDRLLPQLARYGVDVVARTAADAPAP